MILLALDLSIRTGGAVFDTASPELLIDAFDFDKKKQSPLSLNIIEKDMSLKRRRRAVATKYDPSNHPEDFALFVRAYTSNIMDKILEIKPDAIVLEQTNKGRDRWRQKLLEWLHYELFIKCEKLGFKLEYIDTIEWHRILGLKLSKEDRKHNKIIRKHNREKKEGEESMRGLIDDKDLSIAFIQKHFGLDLLKKQNDIADGICLGFAYLLKKGYISNETVQSLPPV